MEMNKDKIPARYRSSARNKKITKIFVYTIVLLLSAVFVIPFLWMVITSLKEMKEIYTVGQILPTKIYWQNYKEAVTAMPFARYVWNTVVITVLCVVGYTASSTMVAYSMSKIRWKGSKYLFPFIVGTMMIPSQVTMIPLYILFNRIGWTGTILPLVVPTFFGGAYYIFLLRQFFMTIPDSYLESATIDGASQTCIFFKIILPLCKPAIVSVAIFAFLAAWSDFFGPMLYLNSEEQYTISLGLQAFMQTHFVEWGPMMAASTIFTVPIIILFFCAQKYFIEGVTVTGIKG